MAIILPISWEYIISPNLYDDKINSLTNILRDKQQRANVVLNVEIPDEANPNKIGHMSWNGGEIHDVSIWGFTIMYEYHYRYQKYLYDSYYPAIRDIEQARDDILRKEISIQNIKGWVFFYNPIVLLTEMSAKIAGNSLDDYLRFFHDSRQMRDDLVSIGIRDGWLLDYRYAATFKEEYASPHEYDSFDMIAEAGGYNQDKINEIYMSLFDQVYNDDDKLYETTIPSFNRYSQPQHSFGEIFSRILPFLTVFVLCIIALWVGTWMMFDRYDVR